MTAFALAAIDAQIADCRASGDTGNVENLVESRAAFAELIETATRLHGRAEFEGFGRETAVELDAVRAALARVKGGAA